VNRPGIYFKIMSVLELGTTPRELAARLRGLASRLEELSSIEDGISLIDRRRLGWPDTLPSYVATKYEGPGRARELCPACESDEVCAQGLVAVNTNVCVAAGIAGDRVCLDCEHEWDVTAEDGRSA